MKIIHILPGKANVNRMNGVNKVVHQLATLMQERNLDVNVWGITSSKDITELRSYPLRLFEGNIRSFTLPNELKSALMALPADTIIHFHGVLLPIFTVIAKLLRKQGIAYVVTPHGALLPASLKKNYWFKKLYYLIFEKQFLAAAQSLQAITNQEKEALSSFKTVTIPNGYPYLLTEQGRYATGNEITFGYIGRLAIAHKGLDILLDGFNQYYKQHQAGFLRLVGDGPDKAKLISQVNKLGLQDRVVFWGEQHGVKKIEILTQMNVFVHPSRWDVLPTAILEAAAHKTPLLVTRATGFADSIHEHQCGIVIENANASELCTAMTEFLMLYKTKALEIYGFNAEKMIKEDYDWNKILNKIVFELYGIK